MIKVMCDKCKREINTPLERQMHPVFRNQTYISVDLCFDCFQKWQEDKEEINKKIDQLEQELNKTMNDTITKYFGLEGAYGLASTCIDEADFENE